MSFRLSGERKNHLDLKALGASEVIELSSLFGGIGEQIMEITDNHGVDGVIDCVGGRTFGRANKVRRPRGAIVDLIRRL